MKSIHSHTILHAIVHGSYTTAYFHIVNPLTRHVIVVWIALSNLYLDIVLTLQTEHRMVEGVDSLRCVGWVLVGKWHNSFFATKVRGDVVLVTEVIKRVVTQLLICQLYWAAIYTVVYSVIRCMRITDGLTINIHIATSRGGIL